MRTFKTTQRILMTGATVSLVSVLALGSIASISGANAAEPTIAVARQFLADLEENRFAFLGSDVPEVVLTASNICSSDGGNGCQYLAVVTREFDQLAKWPTTSSSLRDVTSHLLHIH